MTTIAPMDDTVVEALRAVYAADAVCVQRVKTESGDEVLALRSTEGMPLPFGGRSSITGKAYPRNLQHDPLDYARTPGLYLNSKGEYGYLYWFGDTEHTGGSCRGGGYVDRAAAQAELDRLAADSDKFWQRFVDARNDGNRIPNMVYRGRRQVQDGWQMTFVIGGRHYVPASMGVTENKRLRYGTSSNDHKGFGGQIFRWRYLDDPEGTVYESDNVFTQGIVPARFRDRLPDNAVMV